MLGAKTITTAFVATLALASVGTSTASAAQWYVNGTKLTGSANLATEAVTDKGATLNAPGLNIKITCTGNLLGIEPKITAPDTASVETLTFMSCTESSPANCAVEKEIPTGPVEATATTAAGKEDRILFKPKSGKTFALLIISGASCSVSGEKPVTGTVVLKAPTGQEERVLQAIEGLGSLEQGTDSLQVAGNRAYIEGGETLLKLESGATWSFSSGEKEEASATHWYVNGTKLTGSANLATEAVTDKGATLNAPGLNIKITCTGNLLGIEPKITAPSTVTVKTLTFMGCTESAPANCSVSSEIPTEAVEATISKGTGKEDRALFKPTGKVFAVIDFLGSSCSVAGEKPIGGTVIMKAPTGQEERTLQALEGLGSLEQGSDSIQVAGNGAYIEGGVELLKLEHASKWSFH